MKSQSQWGPREVRRNKRVTLTQIKKDIAASSNKSQFRKELRRRGLLGSNKS